MYAGVVAVPLIVGSAPKLSGGQITYTVSAGLFMSGVATLLQTLGFWKFGARQPLVQGTSFAAVSTILAIGTATGGTDGLRAVFGALLVAGVVGLLIFHAADRPYGLIEATFARKGSTAADAAWVVSPASAEPRDRHPPRRTKKEKRR